MKMNAGFGYLLAQPLHLFPCDSLPFAVFFCCHTGNQIVSVGARRAARQIDNLDLRKYVCAGKGRGILDIIVAGHMLGNDSDGVGLVAG